MERKSFQEEEEGQEQVLESIEEIYFSHEEFDPGKHALKVLSAFAEALIVALMIWKISSGMKIIKIF